MTADDAFSGLPVWVKIVGVLGAPTFFSLIFLAVFLGWVKSPLTEVLASQEHEREVLAEALRIAQQDRRESLALVEYQNILLRSICHSLIGIGKENQGQCEPRYRGYEEPNNSR